MATRGCTSSAASSEAQVLRVPWTVIRGTLAVMMHRFGRAERRARVREYVSGLVAGLERNNGWTPAEHGGEVRARRDILDPRLADRPISAIAYSCGFGDLSGFNRAFKQAYAVSPSELRNASATTEQPASSKPGYPGHGSMLTWGRANWSASAS